MKLKVLAAATVALIVVGSVQGQTLTNVSFTSVNQLIPDGNPIGMSSTTNFSGIPGTVTSVTVNLDITGGFNGDLYAYLAGPAGGFAVLLNRTGVTAGNANGYSDSGFNITLSDGSPNVHLYQLDTSPGGQLTGTWGPDGRNIDPQSAPNLFDSASTATDLSSFVGNTADGTWTLFVADMSSGGQSTLVSWGLSVVTVPEPQTWALVVGGMGVLYMLNRRRRL